MSNPPTIAIKGPPQAPKGGRASASRTRMVDTVDDAPELRRSPTTETTRTAQPLTQRPPMHVIFGGGCLPKDIRALLARGEELGLGESLAFLREVDATNTRRRHLLVRMAFEECAGVVTGRRIAVRAAGLQAADRRCPGLPCAARGRCTAPGGCGGRRLRPAGQRERSPCLSGSDLPGLCRGRGSRGTSGAAPDGVAGVPFAGASRSSTAGRRAPADRRPQQPRPGSLAAGRVVLPGTGSSHAGRGPTGCAACPRPGAACPRPGAACPSPV